MEHRHFEIKGAYAVHFQTKDADIRVSNEWTKQDIGVDIRETDTGHTIVKIEMDAAQGEEKDKLLKDAMLLAKEGAYVGFEYKDGKHQSFAVGACKDFESSMMAGVTGYFFSSSKTYDEIVNNIQMANIQGLEEAEDLNFEPDFDD